MRLEDTIDDMTSSNYCDRFVAEYKQLEIRCKKLSNFLNRIRASELTGDEPVQHDCPVKLLKDQLYAMERYKQVLEIRALIENIEI